MDAGRAIHREPSGLHGQPLERVLVAASGLRWNAAEAAGGRSGARGFGRAVRIFLSYRRGDVGGYAGRPADALHERMGSKSVFQGVLDIAPGQDYTAVIDRALDNSDALLAVIGPGWLAASTPQGSPRLFAGDDYVRLEIARALDRDVRVVPVLVGGASLPAAAELPDVLQRLAQRQAVVLHDETWHQDVDGLMRSLRGEPAVPTKRRRGLVALAVAVPLVLLSVETSGVCRPDGRVGQVEAAGAVEGLLGGAGG